MYAFAANAFAKIANASWLNGMTSFSFAGWMRFASITGGNQYLFRHAGTTNQISFRVRSTTSDWFLSTTVGGILKTRTGGNPSANTNYHVAGTWIGNSASGLALYIDGSLIGTTSTVDQGTTAYDSGDSTSPIYFSARHDTSDRGNSMIEGFAIFPNVVLTLNQIQALRMAGWPHLAALPRPAFHGAFDGRNLAKVPDLSANGRHLDTFSGTITDQGTRGKWEREDRGALVLRSFQGTAGPPGPGPFIKYATEFTHPTALITLSGLTPGQLYEVFLTAIDDNDNESAPSNTVSAKAGEGIIVHNPKRVLLGA